MLQQYPTDDRLQQNRKYNNNIFQFAIRKLYAYLY